MYRREPNLIVKTTGKSQKAGTSPRYSRRVECNFIFALGNFDSTLVVRINWLEFVKRDKNERSSVGCVLFSGLKHKTFIIVRLCFFLSCQLTVFSHFDVTFYRRNRDAKKVKT